MTIRYIYYSDRMLLRPKRTRRICVKSDVRDVIHMVRDAKLKMFE